MTFGLPNFMPSCKPDLITFDEEPSDLTASPQNIEECKAKKNINENLRALMDICGLSQPNCRPENQLTLHLTSILSNRSFPATRTATQVNAATERKTGSELRFARFVLSG
jgi:hypothetical protein